MVILSDVNGKEIRELSFEKFDVDVNGEKDFEITISAATWSKDLTHKSRVFIPDTEYGGVISTINSNSADNKVKLGGKSWRGVLDSHIIEPPTGQDYKTVTGPISEIVDNLIHEAGLSQLFSAVAEEKDVEVTNYQVDRYISLLSTLEKLLHSQNLRLDIKYIESEKGNGTVGIGYKPITDFSKNIEFSQDSQLQFIIDENKSGTNHLICLGKGELKNRLVLHLYADNFGNISKKKTLKGLDEITAKYEENTIDKVSELEEKGIEKFKELLSFKKMTVSLEETAENVNIGDIVGGRDYITGINLSKPIVNIIYTEEKGQTKKEYKLEE